MMTDEATITFRQIGTLKTIVPVSEELYNERDQESAETVMRPYIEASAEATFHADYPDGGFRIMHGKITWRDRVQDENYIPLEHPQYYAVLHSKIYREE
jgi:hypothetical protein